MEQVVVCEHILDLVTGIAVFKKNLNVSSINTITAAIGKQEFFMHVSRFAMSELEFARVNASADEGTICLNMEALGQLKNLSGHDYINGDVKCQEQIRFLSTCKILIASNNNISVGYTTSDPAFKRRLVTIPFEVSIPKEKQDPNLLNKLMAERDTVATTAP